MPAPVPYLFFPGTARAALTTYHDVFGGDLTLHTYAEFGRPDGPADAIAHGVLTGPVNLYGSDVADDQRPMAVDGVLLALLGAAPPAVLRTWFDRLADGGRVLDPLAVRAWGATDGQLVDRHGVPWLIGYEGSDAGWRAASPRRGNGLRITDGSTEAVPPTPRPHAPPT